MTSIAAANGWGAAELTLTTPSTRERRSSSTLSENSGSSPLLMAALPPLWEHQIRLWLQEDVPGFDIGGFVAGDRNTVAYLYAKTRGVLCGVPFFNGK